MSGYGFWSRIRAAISPPEGDPAGFLMPVEAMHQCLERERLRADRNESSFSLVSFSIPTNAGRGDAISEMSRVLQTRLRGSDYAGLLRDGCVGAVLPDTPADGSRNVAEDVCSQWTAAAPVPDYVVYVYPSDDTKSDSFEANIDGHNEEEIALEHLVLTRTPLWKRSLDVAGAICGLIVLSPVFLIAAIGIRLSSQGPVFFKQRRAGRGGRPFWLYKFRSMVVDAEAQKKDLMALNEQDGPAFKIKADPRVTSVGRFLRATSIDELPQLWNVLKGDMSLVGPRPLPCSESDACVGWQRRRLDVTPGLTCFWQVQDERSEIPFADWVRMDLRYIRSHSPQLDLRLMAQTLRFVLRRKGC